MKRILLTTTALSAVCGLTFWAGYSSSYPDRVSISTPGDSNSEFRPPVKGETQPQVRAQYDDPDQVLNNGEGGEIWMYFFGKDKLLGNEKLFNPNYGLFVRVRVLSVHFDEAGRVTSWKTAFIKFCKWPLISF